MIFHAGRFGLPLPPMPTVTADLGRYEGRTTVSLAVRTVAIRTAPVNFVQRARLLVIRNGDPSSLQCLR